jgi:hypothetical protein
MRRLSDIHGVKIDRAKTFWVWKNPPLRSCAFVRTSLREYVLAAPAFTTSGSRALESPAIATQLIALRLEAPP